MHFLKAPLILFASTSNTPSKTFSFQNERLENAAQLFPEATLLLKQEKYKESCDLYMQGIFLGRKVVQELQQEQNDSMDDPKLALDWMIESYIQCSKARIAMGDINTARSDAWAACSFSNNENVDALLCMLTVCELQEDTMGQLQTLKSIEKWMKDRDMEELERSLDKENSETLTLEIISDRIVEFTRILDDLHGINKK